MLCVICTTALRRARESAYTSTNPTIGHRHQATVGHHTSFASFEASAAAGCFACHRLWASIEAKNRVLLRSFDAAWAELRTRPGFYEETGPEIPCEALDKSINKVSPDWEYVPVVPPVTPVQEAPLGLDEHVCTGDPLDGFVSTCRVWFLRSCDRIILEMGPRYRALKLNGVAVLHRVTKDYFFFVGSGSSFTQPYLLLT